MLKFWWIRKESFLFVTTNSVCIKTVMVERAKSISLFNSRIQLKCQSELAAGHDSRQNLSKIITSLSEFHGLTKQKQKRDFLHA